MEIRKKIKKIIENLTGRKFFKKIPFGINPLEDVIGRFPHHDFKIIFDVGANVGQSAKPFSTYFPDAKIYCFEPVPDTFVNLKKNLLHLKNANYFAFGLGLTKQRLPIGINIRSELNSLKNSPPSEEGDTQVIEIDTLSNFCYENGLSHIDYLKIDTEGFDLDVLKGGEMLLNSKSIDFIELETGIDPNNHLHVRFEEIKSYLESKDYFIFGIYEQVQDWVTQKPILRRVNSLFISGKIVTSSLNKD